MNRIITALPVAAAALAAAGFTAAAPAMATTAHPDAGIVAIRTVSFSTQPQAAVAKRIGQDYLALKSDHSLRIQTEGVGVDAQWTASGWSTFNASTCGSGTFAWATQTAGNFLRAKNAGDVQVSTTCDGNTEWILNGSSPITFQNVGTGGSLSANSDNPGGVKVGASWLATNLGT